MSPNVTAEVLSRLPHWPDGSRGKRTIWMCTKCGDIIGRCDHGGQRSPVEVIPASGKKR